MKWEKFTHVFYQLCCNKINNNRVKIIEIKWKLIKNLNKEENVKANLINFYYIFPMNAGLA